MTQPMEDEKVLDSSLEEENQENQTNDQIDETNEEEIHEEGTVSDTEERIQALQAQVEENYERYLRNQADFDNFRRRARQEREETLKYASQNVIEQLLPILDNFERAVGASKANEDFQALVKGVEMIFRQIEQVLEQEGVQQIPSEGLPFDPEVHQAVMQVESDEHESGTVVEVIQKGYTLKDRVIRPSLVKVSE